MNSKLQTRLLCGLTWVVLGSSLGPVTAASPDSTFTAANWSSMNPSIPGADGIVRAAVLDDAGNLYVGGDFTVVGDVVARGVAKWNGSKWSALGTTLGAPSQFQIPSVYAMAVSGRDLYVAGEFTTAGGVAATNIAKWNGSSWTALGSGVGDEFNGVYALAVSGSDLYAGGRFTNAGGVTANSIVKWNGTSWSTLGLGISGGYSGGPAVVNALAVSSSDLYVGGSFRTAGGVVANGIAKWDGSGWTALGLGVRSQVGGDPFVAALAIAGSDLYVGGWFTTAGGSVATNIAKWNGSRWSSLSSVMNNHVLTLVVSGSDLYAGGYSSYFRTAGGTTASGIAKWDGNNWSALEAGVSGSVFALAGSGSDLYAGGYFTKAGGTAANSIAKWNGNSWLALGSSSGINGIVLALAVSGNDLYAGGAFTSVRDTPGAHVAKWNGSSWSALGAGVMGSSYEDGRSVVAALAISGSDLYAGGAFTNAGGIAANHIAKWNGSSWSALGLGISGSYNGHPPAVNALAVSGGDLYAAGTFTTAGDTPATNIAKWNGSSWSAVGSGLAAGGDFPRLYSVRALAFSGNVLFAAGNARRTGWIGKWDGTNWSALGFQGDPVLALAVSGNDLYAGTSPWSVSGSVFRWNGSNWKALGGILPTVLSLAVSGSDLYAGGAPFFEGGIGTNYIAKWNGSSWAALGSGVGNEYDGVYALAVSGSDLYVGGQFATAGGKVSAQVARAYLLELPALSVRRSGAEVMVSWASADTTGFALEQARSLVAPASWVANTDTVTDDGVKKYVTLPATNNPQFFRLRRP